MQFTLRQFFLFFTCLQVWFAAIASGYYLFGIYGLIVFGLFYGIAAVLLFWLTVRWSARTARDRFLMIAAILAAVFGASKVASQARYYGLDISQRRIRVAERLQSELHQDPRFRRVLLSYECQFGQIREWLTVQGDVPSAEAFNELRGIIGGAENWKIEWQVTVPDAK